MILPDEIPAFLHVDVEPDGFQIARDRPVWPGFCAMFDFLQSLRPLLARKSGSKPSFGWYVRTDPQVEEVCGRADDVIARFPDRWARLRDEGDHFGVHMHPLRWSASHGCYVHDISDAEWLRSCATRAIEAFESSMGERVRLYRSAAGHLSNAVVATLDERGVEIETSLEPVSHWGLTSAKVTVGVDDSPIVGAYEDCSAAPRTPYRPDPDDFRRPGHARARRLALVPLTTTLRKVPPRGIGLAVRRLLGRDVRPRSARVLYPTGRYRSDRTPWDLAAHRLAEMERPYLAVAVRTDGPQSAPAAAMMRRLTALLSHPLASRLRFVSPLEAIGALLPAAHAGAAAPA